MVAIKSESLKEILILPEFLFFQSDGPNHALTLICVSFFGFKKKRKTHQDVTEEEVSKVPHSFVMHRGDVGKSVLQLEMDIRHVMEPYTATKLKVITWIPSL